jgi:adenosylcobinamide-GDP ribazoletransferase
VTGLAGAIRLLTRVPVPGPASEPGRALPWFALVGALLGVLTAVAYAAAERVVPTPVAAAVATFILVLATGAIHEDGLADTADAWGGGTTRDETLRILRDPSHGTYGVLALAFSVVLRVAGLAAMSPAAALVALPSIHAISRATTAALMAITPSARTEGLAADYAGQATPVRAAVAVATALAFAALLIGVATIAAAAVALVVAWVVRAVAMRRIGGVTGDVLGAAEQLVEIGLILLLAGLAQRAALPA